LGEAAAQYESRNAIRVPRGVDDAARRAA
jgi:hypothetical protein